MSGLVAAVLMVPPSVAQVVITPPTPADSAAIPGVSVPDSSRAPGAAEPPLERRLESQDDASPQRTPRTVPERARFDQPRWVMLRSLLIPGWGQAHNGAWIKAGILAAGDGSLRWRLVRDERRLTDLNRQAGGRLSTLAAADMEVAAAQAELVAAEASGDEGRIAAARSALLSANLARNGASEAYNGAVGAYNTLLAGSINRRWLAAGVVVYALLDAYIDAHFHSFDVDFRFDPALPGNLKPSGARLQLGWRF